MLRVMASDATSFFDDAQQRAARFRGGTAHA
jgi:hypothetical protein